MENQTVNIYGIENIYRALRQVKAKTANRVLRKVHRKFANPVKKAVAAAAPKTPHNTFRNLRNLAVINKKRHPNAIQIGYKKTRDTWMMNFLHSGTKDRKNRGRIRPNPWAHRAFGQEAKKFKIKWERIT
ncbi:MAG: hypothetical protein HC831_14505 [Chloroflexia bacterium]|nr:hypothetical protein [Chloroflexia bacterium]